MSDLVDRQIVVPGEVIPEKYRVTGPVGCDDGNYSLVKGLARVDGDNINILPLDGAYVPKSGDIIVGVVEHQFTSSVYAISIDGPYKCILRIDTRNRGRYREPESYAVGDVISAKVDRVDEVKEAQIIGPQRLEGGIIISVRPRRVPRIIGRKRSMIELIRDATKSRIIVGQNGLIWVRDGNVELAIAALRKVESEAHTSGLTDRMTKFLKSGSKKN
jgi:exosome complex component RRP4